MSYDFKKFNENKEKILNHLILEYKSIQTGIANPQVLDLIFINAYGSKMQLSHVASISVETSTNLIVSPYDKSLLKEIEKAIESKSKNGELSKDEEIKILEELQNLINISNKEFEEISNKKEKDILTI